MTGALVILAAMVIVGLLLYITDVKYFRHHHSQADEPLPLIREEDKNESELRKDTDDTRDKAQEVCCGMHLVCEKTSLSVVDPEIEYYDDEELDRFIGRAASSYTSEETEEFRDVLMTLLPEDIAGWARSITLRKIELPQEVKDELLMLVTELRTS